MESNHHTLLLVDDDTNIRLLARHGLMRAGYQVLEAGNGLEALDLFERFRPDLMLVDVMMPELDGFETVAAIRNRPDGKAIPLVMLTGADDTESVNKAFMAGANDFIVKPINLPILSQRVRYALASAEREQRLRRVHLEQQSACNLAKLGFWRLQLNTGELEWSEEAESLLGRSQPMPRSVGALLDEVPANQRLRVQQAFEQAQSAARLDLEIQLGRNDSHCIIKLQSSQQVEHGLMIGAFQDVTALRAFEDEALYLVEHDELTGLPNLKLFSRLLQERLKREQNTDATLVVLVVDIDRLHRINETFGAVKGDKVIISFASRLRQALPSEGLLCRLESDSFGVAVALEKEALIDLRHRIEHQLSPPVQIQGRDIFIDYSIGVASYPSDGRDAVTLIQGAQAAERETDKEQNRRFVLFSDIRNAVKGGRVILEADLRRALENQEFMLCYQPQQNLSNQEIVGVEALLRWNHAERGVVSPGAFIPILEETGLIHDVGDWILEEAVKQAASWEHQGLGLRVSVNLAPVQVQNLQLVDKLSDLVGRYQLTPDILKLEITETTAMQSPEQTLLNLQKFKECGFRVAIDDFGTGYSSLAYLLEFPLDTLKIDRAFVKDITLGKRNRAIVTAVTTLSFHLGLTTIAEGVETASQRDYMDALNIDEIQGFLIARALTTEQLSQFLASYQATQ